ncbi:MAG: NAD(P)H-dependent oxidoreductase [Desulfobacteraceae bacterium]|jgi:multimeric flavodoxin WrbA/protein-tyrosine-phosphatase
MFALGLQGSPRKKGNSDLLLAAFMDALAQRGALTRTIEVVRQNIQPCKELTVCEKKGTCPIDDDMATQIYGLLRQADIIVAASPVFFYNVSAQLKALIDRCQMLWARKYMLKLKDPGHRVRRGILLSAGATRGKQLFDGMHLTVKYFFDAVSAVYAGHLTYRNIERRGAILSQPSMSEDVEQLASKITQDLIGRCKVLFACRENACRSQMAAAFARLFASDRLDVACAGSEPAAAINEIMAAVMQEKGIDMAHLVPRALDTAIEQQPPDEIITMGCAEQCPIVPGAKRQDWDLPDPSGQPIDVMRSVRDQIEQRVKAYVETHSFV